MSAGTTSQEVGELRAELAALGPREDRARREVEAKTLVLDEIALARRKAEHKLQHLWPMPPASQYAASGLTINQYGVRGVSIRDRIRSRLKRKGRRP